jgi:hypothetical protein
MINLLYKLFELAWVVCLLSNSCCVFFFFADHFDGNLSHIESTPMWLKPENTIQRGKRAGENTLKKELWAKFEEASTCGFETKFHTVSKNSQKGFLDLLEEASCDD